MTRNRRTGRRRDWDRLVSTYEGGVYVQGMHGSLTADADPLFKYTKSIENSDTESHAMNMGHDHPNWSTFKSILILLLSTVLFSLIAEILVDSMDVVLQSMNNVDEKVIGLTVVAIIPSVSEFYNAIAFAMQGNIMLGLEIGSAYTIQVALVQIPVLVFISSFISGHISGESMNEDMSLIPFRKVMRLVQWMTESPSIPQEDSIFTLVFDRWDFYSVLMSTFILTYIYMEGKSNYFKGSILVIAYLFVLCGFILSPQGIDV